MSKGWGLRSGAGLWSSRFDVSFHIVERGVAALLMFWMRLLTSGWFVTNWGVMYTKRRELKARLYLMTAPWPPPFKAAGVTTNKP